MQVQLSEARQAQLNAYAERHGQDLATALDEALGLALDWDTQDLQESVGRIQRGYASVREGNTRPVSEFVAEFRERHGL